MIKIEHVERGDAMRRLASTGVALMMNSDVHLLLEHSNRGQKSLAPDLTSDESVDILYRLASPVMSSGIDWDAIVDLKVRGVTA